MTLGEKIKQLRLRAGKELSQKELAEKIDIEVTYLSKLENNKVQPYLSEETLNLVKEALESGVAGAKDIIGEIKE